MNTFSRVEALPHSALSPFNDSPEYLPAVDGLRAFAIVAVMSFHGIGSLQFFFGGNGWLGVDLFFVISGFLITRLAISELGQRGAFDIRGFYLRRFWRINPAIWALLLLYLVFNPFENPGYRTAVFLAFLNLTDVEIALGGSLSALSGLSFCWSLAVEEKFYLIFPLILKIYQRFGISSWLALLFCVMIGKLILIGSVIDGTPLIISFVIRFDQILIGCVAAAALQRRERGAVMWRFLARPIVSYFLFTAIVVMFFLAKNPITQVNLEQTRAYWLAFVPLFSSLVAVLLVAIAELHRLGLHNRLLDALSCPPAVFIGRLSYSLYLWHCLAFWQAAKLGLCAWQTDLARALLAFAMAYLSYQIVERPCQLWRRHFRPYLQLN